MPEIQKIVIGISTYGPFPRAQNLIKSIWSNLEETNRQVTVLCVDDGTPQKDMVRERANFCRIWNVKFLHNETNCGIPKTWNRMADFALNEQAELLVIFSDGVRVGIPGWVTRLAHFFEQNDNVGTVGLPTIETEGFNDSEDRWRGIVGRVGAAVGSSFAVRPSDLIKIENPDGSKGYWEDLISFHEEIHTGFKLSDMGLLSYMLPWPPVYYRGGLAFGAHKELTWRTPSPYFPMEEFLTYARSSRWYVPGFEEQYTKGQVDRMMYSRGMFCKYWGILGRERTRVIKGETVDIYDEPQKFVHEKVVAPWPPRIVKWLNRDGKVQECETS